MSLKKSRPPIHRRLSVYIISVILGFVASGVVLVLSSLVVFALKFPLSNTNSLPTLAFIIGCIVCGFYAGATRRKDGALTGIKAALLFLIPIIVIGLILNGFGASNNIETAKALGKATEEATTTIPPQTSEAAATTVSASPPSTLFGITMIKKAFLAALCGAVGGIFGVNKNGGF